MTTSFNWKITGKAGEGIKKAGLIFSKLCFDQGLYVQGYTEYPSLIRGGHNTFQVLASTTKATSPKIKLDFLVTLDEEGVKLHESEVTSSTLTLFDNIPTLDLVKSIGGSAQMKNICLLGASCFLCSLPLDNLKTIISNTFSKKDTEIVELNLQSAQVGYDYANQHFKDQQITLNHQPHPQPQLYLTGNDAIAYGAIAGGLKFYAAYPMTPATSILHTLAKNAKKANIAVRHAEDEIGVINMAIGASFGGVRSMVATSGGGFSLMTEGLGLAGVTETPLVIVNSMRPGPASGMPTWSGQGDLLYVIHASQDEFPRIVMTPGDPEEAFNLTKSAMNLSEKYQLPVIILTDKYLSESYFTVQQFPFQHTNKRYGFANTSNQPVDKPFPRYQLTDTGISSRTLPGQSGGVHLCNSYEHNPLGYATEESQERIDQVNKRAKKVAEILADPDFSQPTLYGEKDAQQTIISWGSNKGAILEALKSLPNTNFIHFNTVWPFPVNSFTSLVKNSTKLITLECNSTGQLKQLIHQQTDLKINKEILKYDGRPFYPSEIITKLS